MRKDMYKVIVERPRYHKYGDAEAARRRADMDGPKQLGMRAGYGFRSLNENLAPLRRYLHAQIGRPWNKVFSEICQNIDRRNTVQQHIHQHIEQFIAIDVDIRGGELIDLRRQGVHSVTSKRLLQPLYVDPRTGLVRKTRKDTGHWNPCVEQLRRWQAECAARRRTINDSTILLRLNELWFEVVLEDLPPARVDIVWVNGQPRRKRICDPRYDIVLRKETQREHYEHDRERADLYGMRDKYAVSKRQLSRQELKTHKLR